MKEEQKLRIWQKYASAEAEIAKAKRVLTEAANELADIYLEEFYEKARELNQDSETFWNLYDLTNETAKLLLDLKAEKQLKELLEETGAGSEELEKLQRYYEKAEEAEEELKGE